MKKVFSNVQQVTHVWAQQTQETGRNSTQSAWFDGTALYSYNTPIANFVTNHKGEKACLITTQTYSSTTSANMPRPHDIPNGTPVFHVLHIGINRGRAPQFDYFGKAFVGLTKTAGYHKANLYDRAAYYASILKKLVRARANKDWHEKQLEIIRADAERYCKFFGLRFTPAAFPLPSLDTLAVVKQLDAKQIAAAKAKEKKRQADFAAAKVEAITKWRAGELDRLDYRFVDNESVMLRRRGENVQTSRGADFPIGHAIKAYALIQTVMVKGEAWHTNGHKLHLGVYKVDTIETDGTVIAGCHTVKFEEIKRMATELGL